MGDVACYNIVTGRRVDAPKKTKEVKNNTKNKTENKTKPSYPNFGGGNFICRGGDGYAFDSRGCRGASSSLGKEGVYERAKRRGGE